MQPHMSNAEKVLLTSFLRCSSRYLEFGSGGSTVAASSAVKENVLSIDSSKEWLGKVAHACATGECPLKPTLFHVDIGPTGDWGAPINAESRHLWPAYHETVWEHEGSQDVDLFFIDGRFRVACFMQALLHCGGDSLIMIHDFASRAHYQIIREVAREIAVEENFSVFVPISGQSQRFLSGILTKYRHDGR